MLLASLMRRTFLRTYVHHVYLSLSSPPPILPFYQPNLWLPTLHYFLSIFSFAHRRYAKDNLHVLCLMCFALVQYVLCLTSSLKCNSDRICLYNSYIYSTLLDSSRQDKEFTHPNNILIIKKISFCENTHFLLFLVSISSLEMRFIAVKQRCLRLRMILDGQCA